MVGISRWQIFVCVGGGKILMCVWGRGEGDR